MRVGFVGLGIMGWPMAENLVQAGYDLTVHNRTQKKAQEFAKNTGARLAESPKEVAKRSDIVITMLPGPPEVEEVFLGEDGLIEGAGRGGLLVDMSTSSPLLARKIAEVAREQGASALDAPVSGGDVGAKEGTLSIMVGGEQEDFERARPLFEVMGRTITHVGPSGAGQVVKAANQIVVALSIEAVSEALVLGERGGVSAEKILDVLSGGLAANRVMEVKREKFLSRSFEPGGKARYHRKDLRIALESGREYGVALPATALVEQLFGALESRGRGDLDHSSLMLLLEELAGRQEPVRSRPF